MRGRSTTRSQSLELVEVRKHVRVRERVRRLGARRCRNKTSVLDRVVGSAAGIGSETRHSIAAWLITEAREA